MKPAPICGLVVLLLSCGGKDATETEAEALPPEVRTPVTVTEVTAETIESVVELNATSTFVQSNFLKATTNGYLRQVNVKLGQHVVPGQTAFVLRTKEAEALGNTVNRLSPDFHFTGLVPVHTTADGYIQQLNHQVGDYVQDGEQLAVVADANSFGFVLNVPYELHASVQPGRQLDVRLPDGRHLAGRVARVLPAVDSLVQTQQVLVQVASTTILPQNLIATVRLVKAQRNDVQTLPKSAVLTDEAQEQFWVMKLVDSVTAVKTPIVKGLESADRVEIVQPKFAPHDRVLVSGNYGLPDTAKVLIQKRDQ